VGGVENDFEWGEFKKTKTKKSAGGGSDVWGEKSGAEDKLVRFLPNNTTAQKHRGGGAIMVEMFEKPQKTKGGGKVTARKSKRPVGKNGAEILNEGGKTKTYNV